jgi:hypothetical protein
MRHKLVKLSQLVLLTLVAFGLPASPSFAAEYWLCAQSVDKMMPDSTMVPMWGFAMDDNGDLSDGCPADSATVPGPKLSVPSGDSTLTIHLRNDLDTGGPAIVEPVSIVIPGQAMPTGSPPVFDGNRVRSFVQEAGTGGGTQTYAWSNLQPGTYLYESGTHPQVQVQMGLYGAVTRDSAAGMAYPDVSYTQARDLFYSEVDPALHDAVATGAYGSPPWTSTLNYLPKYFLLHGWNGSAWEDKSIDTGTIPPTNCIDSGIGQGDRLLLRLYNAGLRELAPMLLGAHFDLVAEGGKKYPFARTQYQTLLMPGSTKDAVFTPEYEDDFKVIERRLNLTDAAASGGGMQTCIMVAGVANNAPAVMINTPADGSVFNFGANISFTGTATDTEDGPLSASLSWTSSIDGSIGSGASFMTSALSAGVHTITASVTDSGGLSGSDSITVTVNPPGTDPVVMITAPADLSVYTEGDSISFTGTATDTEDGDISANLNWNSSIDGDFGTGGSVMTSSLSVGVHTITASVTDSDGRTDSDSITVTVNAAANTAPVVTITNPSDGATFTDAASIPFTGTASDAEDGDISANLNWNSTIDGDFGTGASVMTSSLSLGSHTITASVTDSGGLPGEASITVDIIPATTDTLFCNRARYQSGPDRMTIEVESSDNSGALTMTAVMDVAGNGFGGGDDVALNAVPFTPQPNGSVYRQVTNGFSGTYGVTPTSTSQVRVTSSLGGQCTSFVQTR